MLQNNNYCVNGLYETCGIGGLKMMDLPGNERWSNPGAERTFCRLALDSYKNAKAIDQTRSLLRWVPEVSRTPQEKHICLLVLLLALFPWMGMMENEIKESSLH